MLIQLLKLCWSLISHVKGVPCYCVKLSETAFVYCQRYKQENWSCWLALQNPSPYILYNLRIVSNCYYLNFFTTCWIIVVFNSTMKYVLPNKSPLKKVCCLSAVQMLCCSTRVLWSVLLAYKRFNSSSQLSAHRIPTNTRYTCPNQPNHQTVAP